MTKDKIWQYFKGACVYRNVIILSTKRGRFSFVWRENVAPLFESRPKSCTIHHHLGKRRLSVESIWAYVSDVTCLAQGCGSPVVKVSNHGRHVMSSIPVPLKTRRVGQRCTLNLSRAETSSRWCGVVVRRGGCLLRCRPRHLTMVQNYVVRRQKPSCS
ncbi:uncharacterized protein TNCV_1359831 [Trichonephila clavipes]|nr:uncharacterized protein TNCV_1359831 [Trichonephila clavipes]